MLEDGTVLVLGKVALSGVPQKWGVRISEWVQKGSHVQANGGIKYSGYTCLWVDME